ACCKARPPTSSSCRRSMLDRPRRILPREGVRALIVILWRRNSALKAENAELARDLAWTKQSLAEIRAALRELLDASRARRDAGTRFVEFYRESAIARAQAAERDPNAALN